MKKVLITGGAGFIAHHLIFYLLKNTNWNIVSLDRLDYSGNLNRLDNILSNLKKEQKSRIKVIFHDLKSEINPWIKKEIGKVEVLSVSTIIANALTSIFTDFSVSALFMGENVL